MEMKLLVLNENVNQIEHLINIVERKQMIGTVDYTMNPMDMLSFLKNAKDERVPFDILLINVEHLQGFDLRYLLIQVRKISNDIEIILMRDHSKDETYPLLKIKRTQWMNESFSEFELNQLIFQIKEKRKEEQEKNDFLCSIGHEIKTPLSSIIGFIELIKSEELVDERGAVFLDIISRSSLLLGSYVEDLNSMMEMGSGRYSLNKEYFDLKELVDETLEMFSVNLTMRGRLELRKSLSSVIIHADRNKIKQYLINLLSNAMKYTQEGFIEVITYQTDQNIVLTVKDSGIGIPKDKLDDIFNKFERLGQEDGVIPGLGLGLSISKKIVELHEGTILVQSELGKGTSFSSLFPLSS